MNPWACPLTSAVIGSQRRRTIAAPCFLPPVLMMSSPQVLRELEFLVALQGECTLSCCRDIELTGVTLASLFNRLTALGHHRRFLHCPPMEGRSCLDKALRSLSLSPLRLPLTINGSLSCFAWAMSRLEVWSSTILYTRVACQCHGH
jgi:hypothetical protein